ncbi:MAG: acyl carrier protein [Anaerolinea sp.]|nr:acyl carrier protein [Anaerolinea sp.]
MASSVEGVKEVVAEVMKIDAKDITLDTRFIEDLKADSMDQFFLVDGFCEKFNINIGDEDARSIKTVGDAVRHIDANLK